MCQSQSVEAAGGGFGFLTGLGGLQLLHQEDGIALAGELIDSKKALAVLEKLIQISNQEVMV